VTIHNQDRLLPQDTRIPMQLADRKIKLIFYKSLIFCSWYAIKCVWGNIGVVMGTSKERETWVTNVVGEHWGNYGNLKKTKWTSSMECLSSILIFSA
jgi:hypothetical protein